MIDRYCYYLDKYAQVCRSQKQKLPIMLIRTTRSASGYSLTQPLGIMYLASALRDHGYENIRLLDMRPDLMSVGEAIEEIVSFRPMFVGLSSLSYEAPVVAEIVKSIRDFNPDIHICLGGPFPTSMREDTFKIVSADSIVIGEGEKAIVSLMQGIANSNNSPRTMKMNCVPGVLFRSGKDIAGTQESKYIQDLDNIPLPAWDMIDLTKYFGTVNLNYFLKYPNYMSIITSRGCPYNCAYCHNVMGRTFRKRSVDSVLREVYLLANEYGIREFHIIDDSFNIDLERAKQILEGIANISTGLSLAFPNGIRADRVDEEFFVKAKRAGLYKTSIAIETVSARLQKKIKKYLNLEKVEDAIRICDQLDILSHGFFMLGFPTETEEEMRQTIEFAISSRLHSANFFIVTPYEGTEIYNMYRETHSEITNKAGRFDYNMFEANFDIYEIPRKRIQSLAASATRRFYTVPWRLVKFIRLMPNKFDIFRGTYRFIRRGFFGKA